MILTCPSCGTQYVVKDGAIPPQGRQVRCASCKHSWHQEPDPVADPEPGLATAEEAAAPPPSDAESIAEATMIDPPTGPEAEERAYEESLVSQTPMAEETAGDPPSQAIETADYSAPPDAEAVDDDFSPFAERDLAEPRRRGPVATVLLVAVVVAILAAAFWFLAPAEWKARIGLASSGTTPLQLMLTHSDRQPLASGNELLAVTGRVINPTSTSQRVPQIRAQLRSRTGHVVYSWTIDPPAPVLGPGASATFNSAEVNVPAGGDELTITLGNSKA